MKKRISKNTIETTETFPDFKNSIDNLSLKIRIEKLFLIKKESLKS